MDSHLPQSPPKSPKPPTPKKPPKPPKLPKLPMNKNQKISLLVCIFSAVVFIASATVFSEGDFTGLGDFFKGVAYSKSGNAYTTTNYVGMIFLGVFVASFVGYFIFKDVKEQTNE